MTRALTIEAPVKVVSEMNRREHYFAVLKRKRQQRHAVGLVLRAAMDGSRFTAPIEVTLTRIASRELDDDNLAGGFKAIRDEVAAVLGYDDGPRSGVTWRYAQQHARAPKQYGVRITIREVRGEGTV